MNQQWIANNDHIGYRICVSLLMYGLYLQWPLPWLTASHWQSMETIIVVIIYPLLVMLLSLWRMPLMVAAIVYSSLIGICLALLFKNDQATLWSWIYVLVETWGRDIFAIFTGDLLVISSELQTLLLLIGVTMLLPALQQFIWWRQWSYSLFAVTCFYLLVIQLWFGTSVFYYMWLTIVIGLLLVAMTTILRIQRLLDVENISVLSAAHAPLSTQPPAYRSAPMQKRHTVLMSKGSKWWLQVVSIIVVIGGLPLFITMQQDKQMEQPQFVENWNEQLLSLIDKSFRPSEPLAIPASAAVNLAGNNQATKVVSGYSFHDNELGAPFQNDNRTLFYGQSAIETYWRGETKSYYDGRGWQFSPEELQRDAVQIGAFGLGEQREHTEQADGMTGQWVEQTITFVQPQVGLPLFSASEQAQLVNVGTDDTTLASANYYVNATSGAMYMASRNAPVQQYTTRSYLTPLSALQQQIHHNNEPVIDIASYVQLPKDIPQRVQALAADIVSNVDKEGEQERYKQVKAIEHYLQQQYTYTRDETEVPPAEVDFVDHFLFEQQSGYCVHFSSAMVVMLRTLDIPARWVKGFTPGTLTSLSEQAVYEVNNANAHAWVEVYFDNVGWLPFEPTPGYNGALLGAGEELALAEAMAASTVVDPAISSESNHDKVLWMTLIVMIVLVTLFVGIAVWRKIKTKWTVSLALLLYARSYKQYNFWQTRWHKLDSQNNNSQVKRAKIEQKLTNLNRTIERHYMKVIQYMWQQVDHTYVIKESRRIRAEEVVTWQQKRTMLSPLLDMQQQQIMQQLMLWYDEVKFAPIEKGKRWQSAPEPRELHIFIQHLLRNQSGIKISHEQSLHQRM
ncbi:transglutaminase domain-containing protein [Paenibacillus yanchengensis]|uniref:Transglutaminase domain-containing protein n=1 Tax=Paenibacillus yanchengensis TaxID=2035833 RepID=A0ABW4YIT7_9BACL